LNLLQTLNGRVGDSGPFPILRGLIRETNETIREDCLSVFGLQVQVYLGNPSLAVIFCETAGLIQPLQRNGFVPENVISAQIAKFSSLMEPRGLQQPAIDPIPSHLI
jgi:hypothetical protein